MRVFCRFFFAAATIAATSMSAGAHELPTTGILTKGGNDVIDSVWQNDYNAREFSPVIGSLPFNVGATSLLIVTMDATVTGIDDANEDGKASFTIHLGASVDGPQCAIQSTELQLSSGTFGASASCIRIIGEGAHDIAPFVRMSRGKLLGTLRNPTLRVSYYTLPIADWREPALP